jgi:hypothetical protein
MDNVVSPKFVDRILDPFRVEERNVSVDPRHVFPRAWKVLHGIVDQILLDPYVLTHLNREVLPNAFHLRQGSRAETLDHDKPHTTSSLTSDKLDEQFSTTLKSTKVEIWQNHVKWFGCETLHLIHV